MISLTISVLLLSVFTFCSGMGIPKRCKKPSFGERYECCTKYNLGCVAIKDTCTIGIGFTGIQAPPCEFGAECVITDFGFPAADKPVEGVCTHVKPNIPKCSVPVCSKTGGKTICKINGRVTRCEAWATRSDFGPKPDCMLNCSFTEICVNPPLVASNDEIFCDPCLLQQKSCEENFAIYGPVGVSN